MARGEAFVVCPQCSYQSLIPFVVLQHNAYHCSRCGNPIPLGTVNTPNDSNGGRTAPRSRPKTPFHKRKRH